jgi:hypothetical protein
VCKRSRAPPIVALSSVSGAAAQPSNAILRHDRARASQSIDGTLVPVSIISKHFDQAPYEAVMRVSRQRVKMGFKFLAGAVCDRYPCHIVFTGVRLPR